MSNLHRIYEAESHTLGEIGAVILDLPVPDVEIRLPKHLADRALAAWQRDDEGDLGEETCEQARVRGDAAGLALIGAAIELDARSDGDYVITRINPVLLGRAIDASDQLPADEVDAIRSAHT